MTRLVRADNPGPMTLDGTNTWLVGVRRILVVDPGPADASHVANVIAQTGGALAGILLTHRHRDHTGAMAEPLLLAELSRSRAPVLALDPSLGVAPSESLLAAVTDEVVQVLAVPGHTSDSVALVLPRLHQVLTGDTVLGRGTSIIAHPDGDLTQYFASLEDLLGVVGPPESQVWTGLPGHGPVLEHLGATLSQLRTHRLNRIDQVCAVLTDLDTGPAAALGDSEAIRGVVARIYPELDDPVLLDAAAATVRATLVHLSR